MSRRSLSMLATPALAVTLAACGLAQRASASDAIAITVTSDFGTERVASIVAHLARSETVARLLRRHLVGVRLGPDGSIASLDGLAAGPNGKWFYFVNGIGFASPATTTGVRPGDRLWLDLHDPAAASMVPAVVGAFPEPFVHGTAVKRRPTVLACAGDVSAACTRVSAALRRAGVPVADRRLGTSSGHDKLTVLVGTRRELRGTVTASLIDHGPSASGVYARFAGGGAALELLNARGDVDRTVAAGAGLIAATRDSRPEPTWVVTGTDVAGVSAAARVLEARRLRDRFALAVVGGIELPLPQPFSGATP